MRKQAKGGFVMERLQPKEGVHDEADWCNADPDRIQKAIEAAAVCGGAIRFGYTRDGGAYSIGIYGDGEPYTLYVRPGEDIDGALGNIEAGFRDLKAALPPGRPKR